jgi:hypothetical protein
VGLTLPAELTEPLGWIGLTWPEADEELLFEAGQQWISFGQELAQVSLPADTAAGQVWATGQGEAVDAFQEWWTNQDGPQPRLAEDAAAAMLIGSALMVFAAITLALKIAFIIQLILLAIQVAQAIATAFATFGATTAEVPGFIAATRLICRKLIQQVINHITTVIKDILLKAKNLLKKTKVIRKELKSVTDAGPTGKTPAVPDFEKLFPSVRDVNPKFSTGTWGYTNNCQSCVVATERTLSGTPSQAVERVLGAKDPAFDWPSSIISTVGKGPLHRVADYNAIDQELRAAGHGARGIVHGARTDATGNYLSGHVFNAVNDNGIIHYIDGQIGDFAQKEAFGWMEFIRTN